MSPSRKAATCRRTPKPADDHPDVTSVVRAPRMTIRRALWPSAAHGRLSGRQFANPWLTDDRPAFTLVIRRQRMTIRTSVCQSVAHGRPSAASGGQGGFRGGLVVNDKVPSAKIQSQAGRAAADNSPAFQGWGCWRRRPTSPGGTADAFLSSLPGLHLVWRVNPAINGWAIVSPFAGGGVRVLVSKPEKSGQPFSPGAASSLETG
jgi:hypothetical protein